MIVKLKENTIDYLDLTMEQAYFVIGIEADYYRILNDFGKPYLYPPHLFDIIEPGEPSTWITEYGDDGERYSYPPVLKEAGFFEDYFEGKDKAISWFWHVINNQLSEFASRASVLRPDPESLDTMLQEGRIKKLLEIAAEIVQAQASVEPMSTKQIEQSLIDTFSTLKKLYRAEEAKDANKEPRQSLLQKKTVKAAGSGYAAKQKTGKPTVKNRSRTRKTA